MPTIDPQPSSTERVPLEHQYQEEVIDCQIDHDGRTIPIHSYTTEKSRLPPYLIAHDLGEQISDLKPAVAALKKQGANIYLFEVRGYHHENTAEINLQAIINDLTQVLAAAKHHTSGSRPVLVAHGSSSISAITVARLLGQYLDGLALYSPSLYPRKKLHSLEEYLIKVMVKAFPQMRIPSRIQAKIINPKYKKRQPLTAPLTVEILEILPQIRKNLSKAILPCLVVHPSQDPIYKYDFIKRLRSKNKNQKRMTVYSVEHDHHDLLTSSDQQVVENSIQVLIDWTQNRHQP